MAAVRLDVLPVVLLCASLGCGAGEDGGDLPPATTNRVVLGVLSDLKPGVELARLRIAASVGGQPVWERILKVGSGDSSELVVPHEISFPELPFGTRVDVRLEAYETMSSEEAPIISRESATSVVAGAPKLLRVRLERECIPNYQLSGTAVTPTCELPETCIAAACTDPFVPGEALEDYRADWATDFADACKPAGAGEPSLEIGEGREAWRSLEGDDVMQLGAGFQGGYHVWVALRMKNLHQSGSLTDVTGEIVDPAAEFPSMMLAYGYQPADGSACDLVGLRFEVPEEFWVDVNPLLGATMNIRAKVTDPVGDVGFHEVTARVSDNFIKDVTD